MWGFFFELQAFAQQNYIVDQEPKTHHARDWGAIHAIWIVGGIIGAVLGAFLYSVGGAHYVWVTVGFLCTGLAAAVSFALVVPYKKAVPTTHRLVAVGVVQHFRNLKNLFKSFHSLVAIGALGTFVEAAFWSFGALFVLDQFGSQMGEWVFLILFLVMTMLSVIVLERIAPTKGRPQAITLLLLLSGLWLIPFFFEPHGYVALILIAGFGLMFGAIAPLNESLFSDVLSEAKVHDQDILALDKAGNSLGYALGPMVVGAIAHLFGYYIAFGFLGLLCCTYAVVLHLSRFKKAPAPSAE